MVIRIIILNELCELLSFQNIYPEIYMKNKSLIKLTTAYIGQ